MTAHARAALALSSAALLLAGCEQSPPPAAFHVAARGPAHSCSIEVAGRTVSTDELYTIARQQVTKRRAAHIDTNSGKTPYRCIGGVIFTLQRAGFKKFAYITEPPAPDTQLPENR
jgi:hypothetical protein